MVSLRIRYYHVTFLFRRPVVKDICADVTRWWSEWHECYLDNSNIPVYGARMIFSPKLKPD